MNAFHRLYNNFCLTHYTYHPERHCRLASGDSRNLFFVHKFIRNLKRAQDHGSVRTGSNTRRFLNVVLAEQSASRRRQMRSNGYQWLSKPTPYISLSISLGGSSRVIRFIVFFFFGLRDILCVNWYSLHIWAWFILVLFCLCVCGLEIRKSRLLLYYSFSCFVNL